MVDDGKLDGWLVMMEALVRVDLDQLRRMPSSVFLATSGVRYEPLNAETYRPVLEILRDKVGDAEDLACWRVAELRRDGEQAEVVVLGRRDQPFTCHVRRADGTLEDPTKLAGSDR